MSNYKRKRHYRVAEKEVTTNLYGKYVSKDEAKREYFIFALLLLVAFFKGILFSNIFSRYTRR